MDIDMDYLMIANPLKHAKQWYIDKYQLQSHVQINIF